MAIKRDDTTMNFMDWMISKASRIESNAAHSGERHDGGARHVRELLAAYTCGREGCDALAIPALSRYIPQYRKETDPEWEKFKKMAEKFGVSTN